jgi:hypothetical protein
MHERELVSRCSYSGAQICLLFIGFEEAKHG